MASCRRHLAPVSHVLWHSLSSMIVPMMRIRHMRMCMHHGLMYMRMAMRSDRHGIMCVVMMAVVVPVGMLMLKPFMGMLMVV